MLVTKMTVETLLLTGAKSRAVKGSEDMHKQIRTGLCSIIKLADVDNVLEEAQEKVADAIILFCQGIGLVPTVQRKVSRSQGISEGDGPKLNITRQPYQ